MPLNEKIITISGEHSHKFKEKGSLFLGQVFNINSLEEAEKRLFDCRKEYYDATHNCYAYKLLDQTFKYSDDGEPNGTAGIRIFNAIEHFQLVDIIVVVTRYYGGTKLGLGPLGKAYYHSAHSVLDEVKKIEKVNYSKIEIEFDYDQTSNVHHFLSKHNVLNMENKFEESPRIICFVKPDQVDSLREELTEVSRGCINIEELGKNIFI
jgi:uncharacterized YigZ family protein